MSVVRKWVTSSPVDRGQKHMAKAAGLSPSAGETDIGPVQAKYPPHQPYLIDLAAKEVCIKNSVFVRL